MKRSAGLQARLNMNGMLTANMEKERHEEDDQKRCFKVEIFMLGILSADRVGRIFGNSDRLGKKRGKIET